MRISIMIGLVLLVSCPVQADDTSPSDATAKAIAPFVDESTILIVHADISRLDPTPFIPVIMEMTPGNRRNTPESKRQGIQTVDKLLDALAQAGANKLYLVFSLRILDWPALVVPLPEDIDQTRLKELMQEAEWVGPREVKGALVVAPNSTFDYLATASPDPRPEMAAAFEAAGDKASTVLIMPPKHMAQVLEAVLPTLPDELGGGPSSVIANLQWVALGTNVVPPVAHRAVAQANDEKGAVALREKWSQIVELLGQSEDFRKIASNYDQIAPQVIPKVEGDRLVLVQPEGSPGAVAIEKMLESVFQWARSRTEQREGEDDRSE